MVEVGQQVTIGERYHALAGRTGKVAEVVPSIETHVVTETRKEYRYNDDGNPVLNEDMDHVFDIVEIDVEHAPNPAYPNGTARVVLDEPLDNEDTEVWIGPEDLS
jgi:hypothetical protein